MKNNRPIYFIGVDDETRARLKREAEEGLHEFLMRNGTTDPFEAHHREMMRRMRDAEDPAYNWDTWGGGDAA
jgi:hypothetical protein